MKSPVSFRQRSLAYAVCAFVLLLLVLFGRSNALSETQAVPTSMALVRTTQAAAGDAIHTLRLPARAEANQHVLVHARATGIVAERRVELGDSVKSGQVLAVIQAPEIDQEVREAEAEAQLARANLSLAMTHYERARKLVESNAISRELHDDRLGAFQVAQASLAAAFARLENLRERQSFQQVRAPIDGVITARSIERGDRVIADQGAANTPLFELSALDPLRIVVDVPQSTLAQVEKGRKARVSFPGFLDAEADSEVIRLSQRVDSATGAMRVELHYSNPRQRVRPGMVGYAEFSLSVSNPPTRVPTSAVIPGGDADQVIVVGSDSKLDFRTVRLGRNLGDQVEIVAGIADGEVVVLAPNARFKPGDQVKTQVK